MKYLPITFPLVHDTTVSISYTPTIFLHRSIFGATFGMHTVYAGGGGMVDVPHYVGDLTILRRLTQAIGMLSGFFAVVGS